jgi:hypothetical protein
VTPDFYIGKESEKTQAREEEKLQCLPEASE